MLADNSKPTLKKRRKNANMVRENERSIGNLRPAKPGESRNKLGWGGRPYQELVRLCRDLTPNAMEVIMQALGDVANPKLALDAAKFVIERGWGKTPLEVRLADENRFRAMSDAELNDRVREIMNNAQIINATEIKGDKDA